MPNDIFDRESGIPIYRQLAEYIKSQITSGVYCPGDVLPSEADLMRDYNLSRTTVRLAFGLINNAGLVKREQGRGTIVVSQLHIRLPFLSSFSEDARRHGRVPGALLMSKGEEGVPNDAAKALCLPSGEKVIKVVRVRTADNEPIGLAVSWLNTVRYPGLKDLDYEGTSLYQQFENTLGLTIRNAKENIRADLAVDYEARKLKIKAGDPVIRMMRTTYVVSDEENGTPIEYVEVVFDGAVYSIDVELFRQNKK